MDTIYSSTSNSQKSAIKIIRISGKKCQEIPKIFSFKPTMPRVATLRKIYSLGKVDARMLRKNYREQIRISDQPNENGGKILNYAPCTVACVQLGKEIAGREKVSSLHLLKVLLDDEVPERTAIMNALAILKMDLIQFIKLQ